MYIPRRRSKAFNVSCERGQYPKVFKQLYAFIVISSSFFSLQPAQFTVMNYRVSGDFLNSIPFRAYTTIEEGDVPKWVEQSIPAGVSPVP